MIREKLTSRLQPKTVQAIIDGVENASHLDSRSVMDIILKTQIDVDDISAFVDFRHGVDQSFGRIPLYQGKNFEIFLKTWRPGDYSALHDIGFANWGAIKVFGQLDYKEYQEKDGKLISKGMIHLGNRNILGLNPGVIHQMGNTYFDNVISLHVYGNNKEEYLPNILQDQKIYDLTKEIIHTTDFSSSYELPSHQIKRSESGLGGDYPTWLYNLICQINRNKKMGQFNRLKDLLTDLRASEKKEDLLTFLDGKLDEEGNFKSLFDKKVFANAIIGLGNFISEYPEYHPRDLVQVQKDKLDSIFIVKINEKQMLLDYSSDKLVIS